MTTMEMTASIKQGKAMTTEKALREALENSTEMLRHCRCLDEEGAVAEQISENRAALSFPETVGEPVAKVADAPDAAPESVDEPAEKASEQIIGSDGKAFPQTFDAQAWAKAFNETLTVLGHPQHDEGWLIGWFANAIMRGFDEANWRAAHPSQPAQGEPVAWLYTLEYGKAVANKMVSIEKLNYPFGVCGSDYLAKNDEGISYVRQTPLCAAPSSQPARSLLWSSEGYNGAIRVAADACAYLAENERPIEGEQRYNSVHLHQISEELELTIAMLAAAPAAPPVPKTPAQEGERKWRAFTWPNGEGEPPLVCLRHGMADITPPCRKWCGGAACTPPTQAKSTNGEGA